MCCKVVHIAINIRALGAILGLIPAAECGWETLCWSGFDFKKGVTGWKRASLTLGFVHFQPKRLQPHALVGLVMGIESGINRKKPRGAKLG
jgi:hypothetical protein